LSARLAWAAVPAACRIADNPQHKPGLDILGLVLRVVDDPRGPARPGHQASHDARTSFIRVSGILVFFVSFASFVVILSGLRRYGSGSSIGGGGRARPSVTTTVSRFWTTMERRC